jgi:hypothetical protein
MHAGDFAATFAPEETALIAAPALRRFADAYVAELKQARRRVATYRVMLATPSALPDRLDATLLFAESRRFLSDPEPGLALIRSVNAAAAEVVFGSVTADVVDVVTLTSSRGSGIPVGVHNDGDEAVRITVRLVANELRGTPAIDLELGPGESQDVTFPVEIASTGRFEVRVLVSAPDGRVVEEEVFVVRSTVYNRIALAITIAAAMLLLGLWVRRFVPRRTS